MKRFKIAIAVIVAIFIFVMIQNRWPTLFMQSPPFSSINKEVAFDLINQSPYHIVKLTKEDNFVWYGARFEQGKSIDMFIKMMKSNGWAMLEQDGAGYFFIQRNNKIVVTTQMWSGEIILFKVPASAVSE